MEDEPGPGSAVSCPLLQADRPLRPLQPLTLRFSSFAILSRVTACFHPPAFLGVQLGSEGRRCGPVWGLFGGKPCQQGTIPVTACLRWEPRWPRDAGNRAQGARLSVVPSSPTVTSLPGALGRMGPTLGVGAGPGFPASPKHSPAAACFCVCFSAHPPFLRTLPRKAGGLGKEPQTLYAPTPHAKGP